MECAELLFTLPATRCYLVLITAPRSVVTQTLSDPPRSASRHTDRQRTLTHFVGELADAVIYVPFFPRVRPCARSAQLLLGQKKTVCAQDARGTQIKKVVVFKYKTGGRNYAMGC